MLINESGSDKVSTPQKIALGVFDGVHLGHRELISKASLVVTFSPHPQLVTGKRGNEIKLLTTLEEKKSLIPNLKVVPFNERVALLSPEDFVRQVLLGNLNLDTVIVGYDYVFGKDRQGNIKKLIELGDKYGFNVDVVEKVQIKGKAVKSSNIRKLIANRRIEEANEFLGRDYFLFGRVVSGKGLGRKIGFPTVNLEVPEEKLLPGPGVYAGRIEVKGKHRYPCAINIADIRDARGEERRIRTEAHILNFSGDIYGEKVSLSFVKFIRGEQKFENPGKLKEQIGKDVNKIKGLF